MVNWSFLLLWPSQRTLYISARLVAQEIRQSWSHFIAARRSLPPPKKNWCCLPCKYWVVLQTNCKRWQQQQITEHWKFALFVLILSANWNDAHWTLFASTLHTAHNMVYTAKGPYCFDLLFVGTSQVAFAGCSFISTSEVRASVNNRITGGQQWFFSTIFLPFTFSF